MEASSSRVIVTVIGQDKVGIIAGVSTVLAEANANIVDISQTILQEFFTMIMLVDIGGSELEFDEIRQRLMAFGERMGLQVNAQHEDVFKFMHRL